METTEQKFLNIVKLSKVEIKQTLDIIDYKISHLFKNYYNIFTLRQPFFYKNFNNDITHNYYSDNHYFRKINFNSINTNDIITINNDFDDWAIKFIIDNNVKLNSGVLVSLNYIQRDSKIDKLNSFEKFETAIYFKISDSELFEEKSNKIIDLLQKELINIRDEIKTNISLNYNVDIPRNIFTLNVDDEDKKIISNLDKDEKIYNLITNKTFLNFLGKNSYSIYWYSSHLDIYESFIKINLIKNNDKTFIKVSINKDIIALFLTGMFSIGDIQNNN